MIAERRAFAVARVRRLRRITQEAASDPAGAQRSVEAAIRETSDRHPVVEDEADRLLARARRVLLEAFQSIRGMGLLVPMAVGIQRARLRARLQIASVGIPGVPVGIESLTSVVAAATITALLVSGPSMGMPESRHRASLRMAGTTQAAYAQPTLVPGPAIEPTTIPPSSPSEPTVSASIRGPETPAHTRTRAGADVGGDDDRIVVGRDMYVEIAGQRYYEREGMPLWIYCDPNSVIKRAFCSTFRTIENETDIPFVDG